ncbi:MAG: hypothetical protein ACOYW7_11090 [Nitrospirota bacterium]
MSKRRAKNSTQSPWVDAELLKISRTAEKLLGYCDRMLYHSKSRKQPTTIFNANIFNARAKKVWFGDLEIERDREALLKLSKKLGPLYILYEMDGRFLKEIPTPGYVKGWAAVVIDNGMITYSEDFARWVEFQSKKRLKQLEGGKRDAE